MLTERKSSGLFPSMRNVCYKTSKPAPVFCVIRGRSVRISWTDSCRVRTIQI